MRDSLQLSQSRGSPGHLPCLKYFLLAYLLFTLVAEIAWTFYSISALRQDLEQYEEAGEWEPTFVREFFKSSKNFFLFDLIMVIVVLGVGLGAVASRSAPLLISFLVLFSIEWIFELIGVYHSQERQVVMYRMVPALLRPGLLVSTVCYLSAIKHKDPLPGSNKNSGA